MSKLLLYYANLFKTTLEPQAVGIQAAKQDATLQHDLFAARVA